MEVRIFGGSGEWEGLNEGGPEKTEGNMFGAPHPPKPSGRKSILMGKIILGATELLCSFFPPRAEQPQSVSNEVKWRGWGRLSDDRGGFYFPQTFHSHGLPMGDNRQKTQDRPRP